jgi:hypothetical protein
MSRVQPVTNTFDSIRTMGLNSRTTGRTAKQTKNIARTASERADSDTAISPVSAAQSHCSLTDQDSATHLNAGNNAHVARDVLQQGKVCGAVDEDVQARRDGELVPAVAVLSSEQKEETNEDIRTTAA